MNPIPSMIKTFPTLLAILSLLTLPPAFAQKKGGGKNGNKPDSKDPDTWSAEEYSGLRGEKDLQAALASK